MKNTASIIGIIILLFAGQNPLFSQTEGDSYNYLVITQKIEQLRPVALSAAALMEEDGEKFGEFKVVLYGPEVVQLTDKEAMKPILKMAQRSHLTLGVCAMALDKMGIDHKKIPKAFEIIDNAFLHYLQLQKKNYIHLSI